MTLSTLSAWLRNTLKQLCTLVAMLVAFCAAVLLMLPALWLPERRILKNQVNATTDKDTLLLLRGDVRELAGKAMMGMVMMVLIALGGIILATLTPYTLTGVALSILALALSLFYGECWRQANGLHDKCLMGGCLDGDNC